MFFRNLSKVERFEPSLSPEEVLTRLDLWNKAVQKSFNSV